MWRCRTAESKVGRQQPEKYRKPFPCTSKVKDSFIRDWAVLLFIQSPISPNSSPYFLQKRAGGGFFFIENLYENLPKFVQVQKKNNVKGLRLKWL